MEITQNPVIEAVIQAVLVSDDYVLVYDRFWYVQHYPSMEKRMLALFHQAFINQDRRWEPLYEVSRLTAGCL